MARSQLKTPMHYCKFLQFLLIEGFELARYGPKAEGLIIIKSNYPKACDEIQQEVCFDIMHLLKEI
jgi:hypothetical protein